MKTIKFFITPVYPYGNDHYYHEIIAVAEGFLELGYEIFGNFNYWFQPETNNYLIKEDLENNNFEIAIYDYRYVTSFAHLLFRKGYPNFDKSKKHILIDRNDWLKPIWWKNEDYKIFDLIFAGNLYQNINYSENIKPWAIGLTNRIIKSIDKYFQPTNKRDNVTGHNFRVEHNMRGYVLKQLKNNLTKYPAVEKFTKPNFTNDNDLFYYNSTIKRHNPAYYKSLCSVKFFMAFGGYYDFKPLCYQPCKFLDKVLKKPYYWRHNRLKNHGKDFSNEVFIFQQDNFRFWEVLYSGAVAINLDLYYWNFKLPVMPVSDTHYIGIKELNCNNIENTLLNFKQKEIDTIAHNARNWVIEYYSPKAQAQRIISYL
jgi:hypothetical protein